MLAEEIKKLIVHPDLDKEYNFKIQVIINRSNDRVRKKERILWK